MHKGVNFGNNCYSYNIAFNYIVNKVLEQKEKYHINYEMVLFYKNLKQQGQR